MPRLGINVIAAVQSGVRSERFREYDTHKFNEWMVKSSLHLSYKMEMEGGHHKIESNSRFYRKLEKMNDPGIRWPVRAAAARDCGSWRPEG